MATYHAIAAAGQGILRMLEEACPRPEFEGASFQLADAKNFKPLEFGVSIYLFRVVVSTSRRNLPARTTTDGRKLRRPLPVDLSWMMTAWAQTTERQHRLLGWLMRELEDHPVIPQAMLNYKQPEGEIFHEDESVEVIYDPVSLPDMMQLWQAMKLPPQPAATYVARMVQLESLRSEPVPEPVQTRIYQYGKVSDAAP